MQISYPLQKAPSLSSDQGLVTLYALGGSVSHSLDDRFMPTVYLPAGPDKPAVPLIIAVIRARQMDFPESHGEREYLNIPLS